MLTQLVARVRRSKWKGGKEEKKGGAGGGGGVVSCISFALPCPARLGSALRRAFVGAGVASLPRFTPRFGLLSTSRPARSFPLLPLHTHSLEKEYGGEHEPYPVLSDKMIAVFGPNPRDVAEAEAAGVKVQTVKVGARCVETVHIAISKAGEVQWCFKGDLDVGFKCIFAATVASEEAGSAAKGGEGAAAEGAVAAAAAAATTRSELVVVVPARRAVSGAGAFTTPGAGTVHVELDNSFSLLTGKTVKFSVVQPVQ